jgi:hypothetical protein
MNSSKESLQEQQLVSRSLSQRCRASYTQLVCAFAIPLVLSCAECNCLLTLTVGTAHSLCSSTMDAASITASMRVDAATKKGSVIDVIRIVQQCNASDASTYFKRLVNNLGTELGTRCPSLKINGKGQVTPCADACTLVEIVWALPGKAARDFRHDSAKTVCRVLGGDLSLVEELEARNDTLQRSDVGQAAQEFLMDDSQTVEAGRGPKRFKGDLPVELQIASTEQQCAYFELWLQEKQQQLEERRLCVHKQMEQQEGERRQRQVAFVQSGYDLLTQLGVADARDKITCGDIVRRILQEKSHTDSNNSIALLLSDAKSADDLSLPTPDCDPVHRGDEISMHSVATRLNVRVPPGKESQVGKAIKKLYAIKYGDGAASRIPKRNVPFHGQIFAENTYWQRDVGLLEQAILSVVKQG